MLNFLNHPNNDSPLWTLIIIIIVIIIIIIIIIAIIIIKIRFVTVLFSSQFKIMKIKKCRQRRENQYRINISKFTV